MRRFVRDHILSNSDVPLRISYVNSFTRLFVLDIRMAQHLGMPPQEEDARAFIELWVDKGDLFRPCIDPEITDTVCNHPTEQLPMDEAHKAWFAKQVSTVYHPEHGYPFTQLGYTYDWGTDHTIGTSEFVIKENSKVIIGSITVTHEYIQ